MAVTDWSTTAASNTSVGGIDIAGSTGLVSQADDAIRAIMAEAKAGFALVGANTDITSVYLNNTGLKVKDTNASHGLSIIPGSNVTADRTFTLLTGDFNTTLNFTNSVLTLKNSGLQLLDVGETYGLLIKPGSTLTAPRIFTLTTGDQARTIDIADAPANLVFATGTYTPTLTNTTNVAASTAAVTQWYRVGNMVTVFGTVQIDPTTSGIATELRMSLPVASTFGAATQVGGAGAAGVFNEAWGINGATTLASFQTIVATDTNHTVGFQFSYLVL